MVQIKVEITGLEKLRLNSERYSEDVKQRLDDAIQKGALHILRSAKFHCPVDTGRLRNSIRYSKTGDASAEVKTNVEYSTFVEFGTSKQRAQPYMRPAVDENIETIQKEVKFALKNAKP